MSRDEELHGLLNALLDGELSPSEEAEVRAYVDRTPEAQVDLDDLARVRSWVRDLPAVDPPFGFYDRLVSPRSRARRYGPRAVGAFVAAAAAIIVIVGITPVADSVVPPVNAYAERHMHMITPAATQTPGGASPTDPPRAGSSTTIAPAAGSAVLPPVTSARPTTGGTFAAVAAGDLDRMGAPAQVGGSYTRMGGYQSDAGVLHVMYSNGAVEISVYEQSGTVAWDALPSSGSRLSVGGDDAWAMNSDREEVMVVERDTTVYTVVAVGGHDEMMAVVQALPDPPPPSMVDRAHQACRSVVEHFGFDQ
jgi:hypothetical protein